MREVLSALMERYHVGESVGIGTVVATFRSAPRPPGASMLVSQRGEVFGSVSGGCVEGAVYELASEVLSSGEPTLERFGISDDDAFGVGLTCGGILDVYIEKIDRTTFPELAGVVEDIRQDRPVAIATVVEHPDAAWVGHRMVIRPGREQAGTLGSARADSAVLEDALGLVAGGRSSALTYGPDGQRMAEGMRVFVSTFAPQPRMLVFGAIDFAAAVAKVGSFLGYRVTVCDARPIFATNARFPAADEVVVEWPHRYLARQLEQGALDSRTAVVVLTHDHKFDVPLLEVALREPGLAYVGAMGSRRTHEDRVSRLCEAGITDDELAGLSSPIGLDLGARTPEETAISIAAEIIARQWGGNGERLRERQGPIHARG
ncbi:XdhC/CoxI family protein [Streptomyces sp. NPDC005549]|uniref:XdhC/CoxI family protein n=1 Tax=Streptomyces sp. NPDC005549 TaxID=3154888 RepID=UPI0033A9787A